ncbi:glycosyltransferase family 4 protein [Candidatus Manganitrophus noduliformans]|uniref:Glycosyltransferase family 4 protein n=1 Tax=Candidatus Manganitrophus noduliformans TaxID=2606439 RepID=A0A7X6DPJ7_9BACT|nr:glycosyltransferase family 4 protein [Candidatus Manganitrophus noduliformans]NKE70980.1 glycosyltransferase family 4 protein [Candidatus Manganitrophus noduliformans]
MKIAIIRKRYVAHGGAERFTRDFIHRLVGRGHQVHLIAADWIGERDPKVTFHPVPTVRLGAFFAALTFAVGAYRVCRRNRFDLVQSHERTLYQDLYRAGDGCHREWLLRRRAGASLLKRFSIAINPFHRLMLWIEKRLMQRSAKIVAISNAVRSEIIRHYQVSPEKIAVIYNPVDLVRFHPDHRTGIGEALRAEEEIKDQEKVILFVGSGFERKGLGPLIEAIARLGSLPVKLWVVGKGSITRYQRQARDLGLEGRVRFFGPVPDAACYYAAADLFVFPTLYEPFGQVHLEALASALPVITHRHCGGAELIRCGVNGDLLDSPTDSKEIAERIQKLIMHPHPELLREAARKTAEEYPPGRILDRWEALYEEMISAEGR